MRNLFQSLFGSKKELKQEIQKTINNLDLPLPKHFKNWIKEIEKNDLPGAKIKA